MQMNAEGHQLSIAAIKWTILQQGVREPTGVAIPARGACAIPGVVTRSPLKWSGELLQPEHTACSSEELWFSPYARGSVCHSQASCELRCPLAWVPRPTASSQLERLSLERLSDLWIAGANACRAHNLVSSQTTGLELRYRTYRTFQSKAKDLRD